MVTGAAVVVQIRQLVASSSWQVVKAVLLLAND